MYKAVKIFSGTYARKNRGQILISRPCFGDFTMSTHLEPIAQVTQRATDALVRELGIVDAMRFLGQFRAGSGDYTAQRQGLLAQIKARRGTADA